MLVTTERIGRQLQKRAVALVGLGHQILRLSQPGIRAHGIDAPADHDGRIKPARGQHRRDHGSRGGLAVHAGDGDAVFQPHQLGQHLGALNHGDVQLVRFGDLGIIGGDGGTGDDDFGARRCFPRDVLRNRRAQARPAAA